MEHEEQLTADELRDEARRAVEASGRTRASVAESLGVSPSAVSLALNSGEGAREASRYGSLLIRIVELLTDFTVSDESIVIYRAYRRD